MLHNSPKKLTLALLMLPMVLSGCLNEDTQPQPEQSVTGRIVLNETEIEGYVEAVTRSTQSLADYTGYTYTLSGTSAITHAPNTVTGPLTELVGGASKVVEAGTYTLTVSNEEAAQTGYGFPTYKGTSETFTLGVDETMDVSVNMGRPSNSQVRLAFDSSFSTLYDQPTVTLTLDSRSVTVGFADNAAEVPPYGTPLYAYFPAGKTISYTVSAAAKRGSHVTDITSATGTIDLTAGCYHTLTLRANPVTGELIPIVSGSHNGEFD